MAYEEDHQESVAEVRKDCAMQRLKPLDLYACALFPASSERTLPFGAKYSLQSRPLSTATCYRLIHVTCSSSTSSLPLCSSTFISQSTRFTKPQHLTLSHHTSKLRHQAELGHYLSPQKSLFALPSLGCGDPRISITISVRSGSAAYRGP